MFKKARNLIRVARGEFRSRLSQEVCPFCFENFRLNETPFRCASPPKICAPKPDPVLQKHWEINAPTGRVIGSEGRFAIHRSCRDCKQRSHKRLCPHCHQELPHTFGEYHNYIFALIGAKSSGKSNYIPVLIEQIKREVGPRMGILLQPMNDATINRYRKDFYGPLFNNHKVVETTQSALSVSENRLPMTFSLTFAGKGIGGRERIKRAITLAFFDTAGEDLKAEDTMNAVNKYIYRADGIMLLIDPLQLNPVRDRLLGKVSELPDRETESSDIVSRVTKLIRRGREIGEESKIATPTAIALSKFDAVEPLLDPQLQVLTSPPRGPLLDQSDLDAVDAEIQGLIAEWDSDYLLQQVRFHFKRAAFFGLTALGTHPDDKHVKYILPRRVEDPFLWLLRQHRLIKTKK